MSECTDLLFEVREAIEDNQPIHSNVDLVTRIVNLTNAYAHRSKLAPNGTATRDRLVAAALDVRRSDGAE